MRRRVGGGIAAVLAALTLLPMPTAAAEAVPFPVDAEPTTPNLDTRGPAPDAASKPAPLAEPASEPPPEPSAVVIELAGDVATPASIDGDPVTPVGDSPYAVVELDPGEDAAEAAARLADLPGVVAAAPDQIVTAAELPNDPAYPSQADAFERVGVDDAWTRETGDASVSVAVIDSGIDLDHPDFAGRLLAGYDYVEDDGTPQDVDGHGTRVAGVIAGRRNNGVAIAGVAGGGTKILPLRVLDDDGKGSMAKVAAAIFYAADRGVDVVNLSLGASRTNNQTANDMIDSAVAYARDRGAVVIAAAGNSGGRELFNPAASPGAIGVSATDDAGDTAFFTTFGPHVDLAAPGVQIVSTTDGGGTGAADGTSFAAPIVSGVAALLAARHPNWTADRIVTELLLKAEDRGPVGLDEYYGFGLLDAGAALGVGGKAPYVGAQTAAAEAEPNDTTTQARAVAAGVHTGAIGVEGDVDWWRHTATAGHEVTITVAPPSPNFDGPELDPVVAIHGPDGALLFELDDGVVGQAETVTFTAAAGPHLIGVSNYHGTISPGSYTLSITSTPSGGGAGPAAVSATGPWILSSAPSFRATGVSPNANVVVTSGRDLAGSTVNGGSVVLINGVYGYAEPATVSFDPATDTITVDPDLPLPPNTPYLLALIGVRSTGFATMPTTYLPFSTAGSFPTPVLNGIWEPVAGDFNGDTTTDVVFYAPGSAPDFLRIGSWMGLLDAGPFPVNGLYEPFTLDLNGDGFDDIVWYGPGVSARDFIWYGGPGGFSSVETRAIGVYEPFTLDLNGDGFDDIVWYAPGQPRDFIWYGTSTGHISVETSAIGHYQPFVGELNDDGFDDIFWYAPGAAKDYIWFGDPTGHTSVETTVQGSYRPVSGDFDGDGFGDVVWYRPGPLADYQWLFGPGGTHTSTTLRIDGEFVPVGGDFNGDNHADVLWYGVGTRPDAVTLGGPAGLGL